jgi:hypothetical protein
MHGVDSTYTNHACRCDACRKAHGAATAEQRRRRIARAAADPSLVPHGTRNGYDNWGCRCEDCLEATRARRRRVSAS